MAKKPKPEKGNWTVRMKCVVVKDVFCCDCTKDQARSEPWEYAYRDDIEVEQIDWTVQSVERDQ